MKATNKISSQRYQQHYQLLLDFHFSAYLHPIEAEAEKEHFLTYCITHWNRPLLAISFGHDQIHLKQENKKFCDVEGDHCPKSHFAQANLICI